MKTRKTLDANILKYEIEVYCATMANFWNDKEDAMYTESRQAIYTIISLMVYYMGYKESELLDFARKKTKRLCYNRRHKNNNRKYFCGNLANKNHILSGGLKNGLRTSKRIFLYTL